MGGLGNQLFIIFTVINYSLQHSIPFMFPGTPRPDDRPFYFDTFLSKLKEYTYFESIKHRKFSEVELFVYTKITETHKDDARYHILGGLAAFFVYKKFVNKA
jgi:hypothetical protein